MSELNDITDEQFVPFLKSLGVETSNKSFEWILNDPAYSSVFRWIYENIDENNALTAREECRYAELERSGKLLSPDELERAISELKNEFEGICLPGDQEGLEKMKINIQMDKERVDMLEKQGNILKNRIQKNKYIIKELNVEIIKLQAAESNFIRDEANLGKDCLKLANEVESITSEVVAIVGDTLNRLHRCHDDNELAKEFLVFGPIEQYNNLRELFDLHFDLYCTKRLNDPEIKIKGEEILKIIVNAKCIEGRLSNAISAYIDRTAEVSAAEAKLALVSNYVNPHVDDFQIYTMEVKCNIEMLQLEESLLHRKVKEAAKEYAGSRTLLVEVAAAELALEVRKQIQTDLKWLLVQSQEALALDRLLYYGLRREIAALVEILQFAYEFKDYMVEESYAVESRIESMKAIIDDIARTKAKNNNVVLTALCNILGVNDFKSLVPAYNDIRSRTTRLKENIASVIKEKEQNQAVVNIKEYQKELLKFLCNGCTSLVSYHSADVSAMSHELMHKLDAVEAFVKRVTTQFVAVMNGDKNHMRKLWQWFLTDPDKFIAAVKSVE